jgi:RNA polymerase sigma-70 factor (ECF subfamily)
VQALPWLAVTGDDHDLVVRLQAGEEAAFVTLVDRYHRALLRVAAAFVPGQAVAEEVVQDTWMAVVRGIARFEERSSVKTWLFHIVANRARSVAPRERREVPIAGDDDDGSDPFERFTPDGAWADPVAEWAEALERRHDAAELARRVVARLDQLPPAQRQVVTLRDVEGLPAGEVCAIMGITDGNQRVLLHRGRQHLRGLMSEELGA